MTVTNVTKILKKFSTIIFIVTLFDAQHIVMGTMHCLVSRPGYGLVSEECPRGTVACRIRIENSEIGFYEYSPLYDRNQFVCVMKNEYGNDERSGCVRKRSGHVRCWCYGRSNCNSAEASKQIYNAFLTNNPQTFYDEIERIDFADIFSESDSGTKINQKQNSMNTLFKPVQLSAKQHIKPMNSDSTEVKHSNGDSNIEEKIEMNDFVASKLIASKLRSMRFSSSASNSKEFSVNTEQLNGGAQKITIESRNNPNQSYIPNRNSQERKNNEQLTKIATKYQTTVETPMIINKKFEESKKPLLTKSSLTHRKHSSREQQRQKHQHDKGSEETAKFKSTKTAATTTTTTTTTTATTKMNNPMTTTRNIEHNKKNKKINKYKTKKVMPPTKIHSEFDAENRVHVIHVSAKDRYDQLIASPEFSGIINRYADTASNIEIPKLDVQSDTPKSQEDWKSNKDEDEDENSFTDDYEEEDNENDENSPTKVELDRVADNSRMDEYQRHQHDETKSASLEMNKILSPINGYRSQNGRTRNEAVLYDQNVFRKPDETVPSHNLDEYFDNTFYTSGTELIALSAKLLTLCSIFVVGPIFITVIGIM